MILVRRFIQAMLRLLHVGGPLIILYAVILHLSWGVLLLLDDSAGWATAVHSVLVWLGSTYATAAVMFAVAIAAVAGLHRRLAHSLWGVGLMLPQQAVLFMSAVGAIQAMALSSFADGVVRPNPFIIADQLPAVLIAILHTIGILCYHVFSVARRA